MPHELSSPTPRPGSGSATDTGGTLFVEAGAGSGKTSALVDRVRTLVLTDGVPLSAIAAVTFTEKAGAELRDRLRASSRRPLLRRRRRRPRGAGRGREPTALDDLDAAAIGTLHSFAQQLLTAHPIEAGLPPLVEVLDEVGSSVAFEERWAELQQQLLDDDADRANRCCSRWPSGSSSSTCGRWPGCSATTGT